MVCVEDQSVATDAGKPTGMVVWDDPNASDNSGNVAHVTCDPMSGTKFTIGQTKVTCEAVDGSGNDAECSFRVNVTGNSKLLQCVCTGGGVCAFCFCFCFLFCFVKTNLQMRRISPKRNVRIMQDDLVPFVINFE